MLLMPRGDWHWKFNSNQSVLAIHLGEDLEFLTPYGDKLLVPNANYDTIFRVEHAAFYTDMLSMLKSQLSLSDASIVQIALNATAIHFMLSPQMPKSWHFLAKDVFIFCELGRMYELQTTSERVVVLVVEQSPQAAQVMLISRVCSLSDGKVMNRFDTLKVMLNRLHPITSNIKNIFAA